MNKILTNPDRMYTKNKVKAIKKNNGFCINAPRTEEWRCPCKQFREMEEGWCAEGLYLKQKEEQE